MTERLDILIAGALFFVSAVSLLAALIAITRRRRSRRRARTAVDNGVVSAERLALLISTEPEAPAPVESAETFASIPEPSPELEPEPEFAPTPEPEFEPVPQPEPTYEPPHVPVPVPEFGESSVQPGPVEWDLAEPAVESAPEQFVAAWTEQELPPLAEPEPLSPAEPEPFEVSMESPVHAVDEAFVVSAEMTPVVTPFAAPEIEMPSEMLAAEPGPESDDSFAEHVPTFDLPEMAPDAIPPAIFSVPLADEPPAPPEPVELPEPLPPAVAFVPEPPAPQPRAVVRVHPLEEANLKPVADAGALSAPIESPRAAPAQEYVMEAPVEMWFGDARVGVRAGTATFERFRKYADALLNDLAASKDSSI